MQRSNKTEIPNQMAEWRLFQTQSVDVFCLLENRETEIRTSVFYAIGIM